MSLFKRGKKKIYHYRFSSNGRQYRGSCNTSKKMEAESVETGVKQTLESNKPVARRRRVQTLAEFSGEFFSWLDSLPTDRPPVEATKKYYRTGWRLVRSTKLAGMRIDQITEDDIRGTAVGSSSANTNNALRTLRRMLKQAHKWKQIAEVPLVKLVEEEPKPDLDTGAC